MWHELRQQIGDEGFFDVVRDGRPATPRPTPSRDEYLAWWSTETGEDLAFFDDWLLGPTTPPRS